MPKSKLEVLTPQNTQLQCTRAIFGRLPGRGEQVAQTKTDPAPERTP